ncbi:hypothetical protein Rsub_09227 [Raphidocelis subcapitata]|uniref:Tyrosine-protein kinase ephrin type A/B receptor-like domain-containing protein n=1 Tax=Raphidocelis subcapitata TaxID=307507 RepID=A0A2V0P994_9CHLO|nr:hypothetical protein Rsub_09227 [Raphidocelis subcapitata]|eukprot:GBF96428.1 hypothetical protein Rsub_09227 [Raphidocelis subcapitata]
MASAPFTLLVLLALAAGAARADDADAAPPASPLPPPPPPPPPAFSLNCSALMPGCKSCALTDRAAGRRLLGSLDALADASTQAQQQFTATVYEQPSNFACLGCDAAAGYKLNPGLGRCECIQGFGSKSQDAKCGRCGAGEMSRGGFMAQCKECSDYAWNNDYSNACVCISGTYGRTDPSTGVASCAICPSCAPVSTEGSPSLKNCTSCGINQEPSEDLSMCVVLGTGVSGVNFQAKKALDAKYATLDALKAADVVPDGWQFIPGNDTTPLQLGTGLADALNGSKLVDTDFFSEVTPGMEGVYNATYHLIDAILGFNRTTVGGTVGGTAGTGAGTTGGAASANGTKAAGAAAAAAGAAGGAAAAGTPALYGALALLPSLFNGGAALAQAGGAISGASKGVALAGAAWQLTKQLRETAAAMATLKPSPSPKLAPPSSLPLPLPLPSPAPVVDGPTSPSPAPAAALSPSPAAVKASPSPSPAAKASPSPPSPLPSPKPASPSPGPLAAPSPAASPAAGFALAPARCRRAAPITARRGQALSPALAQTRGGPSGMAGALAVAAAQAGLAAAVPGR